MRRLAKVLAVLLLCQALPLVWAPHLLLDPRLLILSSAVLVIFLTQPDVSLDEIREQSATDRFSTVVILGAASLSQIAIVSEWAYLRPIYASLPGNAFISWGGLAILILGLSLRVMSIHQLGQNFTALVRTTPGQVIHTRGLYSSIRHPSYLGALLGIIGAALFFETGFALILGAISMFLAYRFRIRVEELALLANVGSAYRSYQDRTPYRLIPWVW